jgi:hypothetical protein
MRVGLAEASGEAESSLLDALEPPKDGKRGSDIESLGRGEVPVDLDDPKSDADDGGMSSFIGRGSFEGEDENPARGVGTFTTHFLEPPSPLDTLEVTGAMLKLIEVGLEEEKDLVEVEMGDGTTKSNFFTDMDLLRFRASSLFKSDESMVPSRSVPIRSKSKSRLEVVISASPMSKTCSGSVIVD